MTSSWFFNPPCHYYRDIKLENTLLDESKKLIKITDFGYAKSSQDSMPISNVGTPNYAGFGPYACFALIACNNLEALISDWHLI